MRQIHSGVVIASPTGGRTSGGVDRLECAVAVEGPDAGGRPSTADARWVAHMRNAVSARLRRKGLEDLLDPVRLIVSELVTNAVQHGGDRVALSLLTSSAGLRLRVRDGGHGHPRLGAVGQEAESGRGLWLVDQSVAELDGTWGYTTETRTAWCVLPVSPACLGPAPAAAGPGHGACAGPLISENEPHMLSDTAPPSLPACLGWRSLADYPGRSAPARSPACVGPAAAPEATGGTGPPVPLLGRSPRAPSGGPFHASLTHP